MIILHGHVKDGMRIVRDRKVAVMDVYGKDRPFPSVHCQMKAGVGISPRRHHPRVEIGAEAEVEAEAWL
jgi:hypothetical protein